jgi:hypothetical protein
MQSLQVVLAAAALAPLPVSWPGDTRPRRASAAGQDHFLAAWAPAADDRDDLGDRDADLVLLPRAAGGRLVALVGFGLLSCSSAARWGFGDVKLGALLVVAATMISWPAFSRRPGLF